MKTIYLDAAATTKPRQEVIEAMESYWKTNWYNPSALYSAGKRVNTDIENARNKVGDFINADGKEIYFTSSGCEGNSWAIQGFANYWYGRRVTPVIITSTIEHKSLVYCTKSISTVCNYYINVDEEGFINIDELERILNQYKNTFECKILVSIQFANGEIGTIQHIKEISQLVHKYDAVFHTDAVQAFGHIPIDVKELGIDMLTASGHKIGAPKGVGILYKKKSVGLSPLIYGSQMDNMRGGTESSAYIIGMAKAVELAAEDENYYKNMVELRDYFIEKLEGLGCTLNGSRHDRLPNNINVMLPYQFDGESLVYLLDMCNIQIGVGAACNSRSIMPSPVLSAIGKRKEAYRAIRITFTQNITKDDVDIVINEMSKQFELLKKGQDAALANNK